jgi:phosphohistidine phosphatase SixA
MLAILNMKRNRFFQSLFAGLMFVMIACFQVQALNNTATVEIDKTIAAMKQGGYVIVFRHGSTNRNQADTDPLNYDNVAKQRLLSTKGKEQAKQIGDAFKKLGIPLDKVYTSKFYRAIETGKLISNSNPLATIDLTEGGLVATPIENDRRAQMLRQMTTTIPTNRQNTLIVTHKPNIIDALGKDWFEVKEGEASIFKPDGSSKAILVGRFQANEWILAAKK